MNEGVTETIAGTWAAQRQAPAAPEDFEPLCDLLVEAGLLDPDEEALGAYSLGPYRLAQTPYREAVGDFLQVFIAVTLTAVASGAPVSTAVPGYLSGAVRTFVELLRRGVVFGRGEPDESRWSTLMFIRWRNENGEMPSPEEVVEILSKRGWAVEAVENAIDWLQSPQAISRVDRVALVRLTDTRTLETRV